MSKHNSLLIPHWLQPLLLGLIVFLIYSTTLSYWHTGDDIQLAIVVESSVTGEPVLHPATTEMIINPLIPPKRVIPQMRYFLELPTLAHIYNASKMMNWSDNSIRPVQLTHAVFGTVGVVFFFLALVLFVPRLWSFILSLGLAFSSAWWFYSTHLDYTIISHALSCILLYLMASLIYSNAEGNFQWQVLALGIINALVILYLVTGLMLILVVLAAFFLYYGRKKAALAISLYLSSMLLTIVVILVIVWVTDAGLSNSSINISNNLSYAGAFAHNFALSDVPKTLYGAAKALLTFPTLGHQAPRELLAAASLIGRASFFAWYAIVMTLVGLPFVILLKLYPDLGKHKSIAAGFVLWFLIQLSFGAYWEPSYPKWFTGALVPWWGLIGLLLAVKATRQTVLNKVLSIAVYALVVATFSVNYFAEFLPNSRPSNNPWIPIANHLGEVTEPGDLFISPGYHLLDFYLPYFSRRQTLSFDLILLARGKAAVEKEIFEAVRTVTERDGRVFVYNFSDQNMAELRVILGSQMISYERVEFEDVTAPDFTVYEINGLKP
jgi:hypothetical protein